MNFSEDALATGAIGIRTELWALNPTSDSTDPKTPGVPPSPLLYLAQLKYARNTIFLINLRQE